MFFAVLFCKIPTISLPLKLLIIYVHGTVFLASNNYSLLQKCWFYINGFIPIVLWYILLHLCHLIYQYKHFLILTSCIYTSQSFKVLIYLSGTTDFPSLCVEYISIAFFFFLAMISLIYYKIRCPDLHIFCLVCD